MQTQYIKRATMGLVVLGAVGVAGIGLAPAAHAASIDPSVNASIALSGSTDEVSFSGSGFTPSGAVNIDVYDSNTGALLQTIPVQASAGTTETTYTTQTQQVCPPGSQPPRGGRGRGGGRGNGRQCQTQTVNVPQTTTVGGGTVSTSFSLPYTGDELVVEGVDVATNTVSNQIALTTPAAAAPIPFGSPVTVTPTLNANIVSYGSTDQLQISGSGYTTTVQSGLSVEIVNTATGAVLETIPLPSTAYSTNGAIAATFAVPIPANVSQVGVQVVNSHTRWHSKRINLHAHR